MEDEDQSDDDYDYEYPGYEYFKLTEDAAVNEYTPTWKMYLYYLQLEAPTPKPLICTSGVTHPPFYGSEFFGGIKKEVAEQLLDPAPDGSYLVRSSESGDPNSYRLALRFSSQSRHFMLYHDGKSHYVGEKRFETLSDLVADGLITLYIQERAGEYLDEINQQVSEETNSLYRKYLREKRRYGNILRETFRARNIKAIRGALVQQSSMIDDSVDHADGLHQAMDDLPSMDNVDKPHNFKVHTWRGPHWCDLCTNFLWGVVQQGSRCTDCGFKAHAKCAVAAPSDCMPSMKYVKKVFGVDLTTVCKANKTSVPPLITKCIEEIEASGMDIEGLYRVGGEVTQVEAIRRACDKDHKTSGAKLIKTNEDITTVTSLLKLYLRLLPIPLITFDVYSDILKACDEENSKKRLHVLKQCVDHLPQSHYQTLRSLLAHLGRVADLKAKNKMTAENLAVIFAPSLLRSPDTSENPFEAFTRMGQEHQIVSYLIVYQRSLFRVN